MTIVFCRVLGEIGGLANRGLAGKAPIGPKGPFGAISAWKGPNEPRKGPILLGA